MKHEPGCMHSIVPVWVCMGGLSCQSSAARDGPAHAGSLVAMHLLDSTRQFVGPLKERKYTVSPPHAIAWYRSRPMRYRTPVSGGGAGEPKSKPSVPEQGYGAALSVSDLDGLKRAMEDFAVRALIPHMELKVRSLSQQACLWSFQGPSESCCALSRCLPCHLTRLLLSMKPLLCWAATSQHGHVVLTCL